MFNMLVIFYFYFYIEVTRTSELEKCYRIGSNKNLCMKFINTKNFSISIILTMERLSVKPFRIMESRFTMF